MATLTIRNLDNDIKERLRIRAARHGHSMEEEVRLVLKRSVGGVTGTELWALSRQLFGGEAGMDIDLPPRYRDRVLPNFSSDHYDNP